MNDLPAFDDPDVLTVEAALYAAGPMAMMGWNEAAKRAVKALRDDPQTHLDRCTASPSTPCFHADHRTQQELDPHKEHLRNMR